MPHNPNQPHNSKKPNNSNKPNNPNKSNNPNKPNDLYKPNNANKRDESVMTLIKVTRTWKMLTPILVTNLNKMHT